MSHFKRSLVGIILLIALCVSLFLLVSCDKDDGGNKKDPGTKDPGTQTEIDYGINYDFFMTEDNEEYLFSIKHNTFIISGLNGVQRGTFTYENGVLTLTFEEGDTTNASAKIENDVLTLTYNGGTYRMLKKTTFTVSFDVDGGSETASKTVKNGACVSKPADPVKDGYAFLGWYTDKTYTKAFAFDSTGITQNTTVYARFVERTNDYIKYTASFVGGGETYAPVKTVNGVLYNLPTPAAKDGAAFVGWWMSDYENADKLTRQYTGQVLTQDVTLYAVYANADGVPYVSVNGNSIDWNSVGTNVAYSVTIKCGDTEVLSNAKATAAHYDFDFAKQAAGDYTVTVTVDGKTATAYYRNKGLDRVGGFKVVASGLLVFDPVKNAENYVISVICGSNNHNHLSENNGNSTNFNFANCAMPKDGIRFVVTAKANGYLDSVSTFTYYRSLDTVTGVAADDTKITWNPVTNAAWYVVSLSKDGVNYTDYTVMSGTSYDLTDRDAGTLYVKVTPVCTGYYAEASEAVSFNKTVLARPSGVTLNGTTVVWNKVPGAVSYKVTVNGTEYTVTENSFVMGKDVLSDNTDTYEITVQAIAEEAQANSPVSETVTLHNAAITEVSYRNGYLYWTPVLNAEKYIITIGDSTNEIVVPATAAFAPISFTESGEVKISVCSETEQGERSDRVSITVEVAEILLDVRGGTAVTSLYRAKGDRIVLPATTREGYDFAGWFLSPNGLASGKEYTETVCDGEDLVLYAAWIAKKFNVTLNPGDLGTVEKDTVTVTYGKHNTIITATCTDATRTFVGWFSEPNGAGIRYFDDKGEALFKWNNTKENVTLYAYYAEMLSYKLIDGDTAYSVSKGPYGIGNLTEITIPATYNGKPVTTIASGAFASCGTLVTINIPNTIEVINTGIDGTSGASSCFQSCYKLKAVNIYDADAIEPKYYSVDGILYCNEFGVKDVRYCPYNKTGVIKVEEGTDTISAGVFKNTKAYEIQIPYTVSLIGTNAINSKSLLAVKFLDTPEGEKSVPLTIEDKAFNGCSALTSLTIPARVTEFTAQKVVDCSALTSVDIRGEGGLYTAKGEDGRKVLCSADGTTLIFCPQGMTGTFTIPSGVEVIGEEAFSGCTSLTKVVIPGYVTTISKNAFKGNSSVTEVDMEDPEGQPLTICEAAFYGCSGLESVTLPTRLVKLEVNAFGNTSKLTHVTVNTTDKSKLDPPIKVELANGAFASTNGTSYVVDAYIGAKALYFDIPGVLGKKLQSIDVAEENEDYTAVDGVLFDKGVTKVAFYPIERAGDYTLPETVTEIGANAFLERTGLTGITIGKNVTSIGEGAFRGCNKMTYVTFTEGGTADLAIDKYAFKGCSTLTAVELPARLKTLGAFTFESCFNLASITLPEGLTEIGEAAFRYCRDLTEVKLPSTLEKIELATANTSSSQKDKGACTLFIGCLSLEKLSIPDTNRYYGTIDNVLYQKAAETTTDGDGAETTVYVVTSLLYCPPKKAGSPEVNVPGTVTKVCGWAFFYNDVVTAVRFSDIAAGAEFTIEQNAFSSTKKLTAVTLPKGLTEIADSLFLYCDQLEEITIPCTVTSIGNKAFSGCKNLKTLTFAAPGEGDKVVPLVIKDASAPANSPFNGCTSLTTVNFPERMTVLGNYAFGGQTKIDGGPQQRPEINHAITTVTFPSTIERIGNYAFYYAKNLTSVTFAATASLKDTGAKVTAIGTSAFEECRNLTGITLPAGDANAPYSLGQSAFKYSGLTSIVIPEGVGNIGNNCFQSAGALTSVSFATTKSIVFGTYVFKSCEALTSITLPEGTTAIGSNMFGDCTSLTSITIPASATSIGASAFSGCTSLASVTFATAPESDAEGAPAYSKAANIGDNAFAQTALTSFAFPTLKSGDLTLGKNLFNGCKELATVTLSKSVGKIEGTFAGCSSIKGFVVDPESENFSAVEGDPILYNKQKTAYQYVSGLIVGEFRVGSTIELIGANVFENQIALTKLIIPAGVKEIGNNAFAGCVLLEEIVFEHTKEKPSLLNVEKFGTGVFQECYELRNVTLPGNLTAIPDSTFSAAHKLTSITLPEGLLTIGKSAFAQAGLTSVTIPSTVTTIGEKAFLGASASDAGFLESVTFAKTQEGNTALTTIGNNAFQYQPYTSFTVPKSVTSFGYQVFDSCKSLTTVVFENTMQTMPNSTFKDCTSLTSVTFPSGLTTFGSTVFQNCTALTAMAIPDSVKTLGGSMFKDCINLKSVTFGADSALDTILTNCFEGSGIESIDIPKGVKLLGTAKDSASASSRAKQFLNCKSLKSVTFAGIQKLGGYVFQDCTELTSVSFPSGLTQIGDYCFDGCEKLASVTFAGGTGKMTIGSSAFTKTALTSVEIPANVSSIGSSAFKACENLTAVTFAARTANITIGVSAFESCIKLATVTLPEKVTTIGNYAFQYCAELTAINIPSTVTKIGNSCFDGCEKLATATFAKGTAALTIGTKAFQNTGLTAFEVPARVNKLSDYTFLGCKDLATLTFENRDKTLTLGRYVFEGCSALTSVTLPDQVTSLPRRTFNGCESLATVTANCITTIDDGAFRGCSALGVITLPDTVTSIAANAFLNSGLTSITIPKNCTSIGDNAFGGCRQLTKFTVAEGNTTFETFAITENETLLMKSAATKDDLPTIIAMPGKLTEGAVATLPAAANLGAWALNGVNILKSLTLPEGLTEIPDETFFGAGIESITLPSTLTKIGASAFNGSKLKSITIPASVTEIGDNAFEDCTSLASITFADGSQLTTLGEYAFAGSGLTAITLPAGVTNLYQPYESSWTFYGCEKLTSVTFLGAITELNSSAFRNCTSLTSFTIPATVKSMGAYVFSGSGLTSITIPGTLKALYSSDETSSTGAGYTFQNCTALTTVVFSDGVGYINGSAFKGCTALTGVTIPASVTGIGTNAFEDCTALANFAFPAGTQADIGGAAFKNCTALATVTFGDKAALTSIGKEAFLNAALTSIEIPASVETIGESAFKGCTALSTVTFAKGSKLTDIGKTAFSDSGLLMITLPTVEGDLALGMSVFNNCTALVRVSLGGSVKAIPTSAFLNCTSLTSLVIPETVTSIGSTAFKGSGLTSITVPGSVAKGATSMFENCLALERAVFEEGFVQLNSWTFAGCISLKSVTLPDTLTTIDNKAFNGCTSLSVIEIPENVTAIRSLAFGDWTAEQTIRFKASKAAAATWHHALRSGWDGNCQATIVWDYGKTTTPATPGVTE